MLCVILKLFPCIKQRDLDRTLINTINANQLQCVEVLVTHGASLDSRDYDRNTPLMISCKKRLSHITRVLLNAGARVNAPNGRTSGTALHVAAENGSAECINMLIDRGADMDAQVVYIVINGGRSA